MPEEELYNKLGHLNVEFCHLQDKIQAIAREITDLQNKLKGEAQEVVNNV